MRGLENKHNLKPLEIFMMFTAFIIIVYKLIFTRDNYRRNIWPRNLRRFSSVGLIFSGTYICNFTVTAPI